MAESISLLAIPLALTSNLIVSLGYILQKKATQSFPKIETKSFKENLKTFLTSRLWLIGLFLTILSFPTTITAYSFGNIALVNGIGGVSIVFLTIFSKWILKEKIRKGEYIGLSLVIIGVSATGYFSSTTVTQETFLEFWYNVTKLGALIFFITLIVLAQTPLIFLRLTNEQLKAILFALSAGIYMAVDIISMKGLSIPLFQWDQQYLLDPRVLFIGAIVILFPNIATIMLQFAYQKHKAIVVVPLYNNIVLIIPIIFGALFLEEWSSINLTHAILLSFSIITTIIGTIILSVSKGEKEIECNLIKKDLNIEVQVEE